MDEKTKSKVTMMRFKIINKRRTETGFNENKEIKGFPTVKFCEFES